MSGGKGEDSRRTANIGGEREIEMSEDREKGDREREAEFSSRKQFLRRCDSEKRPLGGRRAWGDETGGLKDGTEENRPAYRDY